MHHCFDEVLDKVKGVVAKKYDDKTVETLEIDWRDKVLGIDFDTGKGVAYVAMHVDYSVHQTKVNGQPYAKRTKNSTGIRPTFCPFCGEKLNYEE